MLDYTAGHSRCGVSVGFGVRYLGSARRVRGWGMVVVLGGWVSLCLKTKNNKESC